MVLRSNASCIRPGDHEFESCHLLFFWWIKTRFDGRRFERDGLMGGEPEWQISSQIVLTQEAVLEEGRQQQQKKGKDMRTQWWVFSTTSLNLFSQTPFLFYLNVFAVLNEPLLADSVKKKCLFFQPSVRLCNNSCWLVKSQILCVQTNPGKKTAILL